MRLFQHVSSSTQLCFKIFLEKAKNVGQISGEQVACVKSCHYIAEFSDVLKDWCVGFSDTT